MQVRSSSWYITSFTSNTYNASTCTRQNITEVLPFFVALLAPSLTATFYQCSLYLLQKLSAYSLIWSVNNIKTYIKNWLKAKLSKSHSMGSFLTHRSHSWATLFHVTLTHSIYKKVVLCFSNDWVDDRYLVHYECNISTLTDLPFSSVFAMGSKVKRLMIPDYKLRIFLKSQTFKVVTFAVVLIINLNTGNVCLQFTRTVCQAN